jgi:hypothetical protein
MDPQVASRDHQRKHCGQKSAIDVRKKAERVIMAGPLAPFWTRSLLSKCHSPEGLIAYLLYDMIPIRKLRVVSYRELLAPETSIINVAPALRIEFPKHDPGVTIQGSFCKNEARIPADPDGFGEAFFLFEFCFCSSLVS